MTFKSKQGGLTLIEMMIALVLGLLVSAAIISVFISNVKSSSENIRMMQLNQELRAVMNFMSDELKRHGFSSTSDPTLMEQLRFVDRGFGINDGDDCVVYAYEDASAAVSTLRKGFRLSNESTIEWSDQNTSLDCAQGNWQDLTSESNQIVDFSIIDRSASAAGITIQRFDVELIGQTQLNPNLAERTIRETIRIRNDDGT